MSTLAARRFAEHPQRCNAALGANHKVGTVPQKLVGSWTRSVTAADIKKADGYASFVPQGIWSLTIKRSGEIDFYRPDGPEIRGESESAGLPPSTGANQVELDSLYSRLDPELDHRRQRPFAVASKQ
jgi:hypothetical protein